MKTYCIFLQMSTGYINGTIPPQFSEDHKEPIEGCGSNSVMLLDNRNSINTMFNKCLVELKNRKQFIGFKIVKCASLLDKYHLITNYIYPNTIK
jgi:hypothetical protein